MRMIPYGFDLPTQIGYKNAEPDWVAEEATEAAALAEHLRVLRTACGVLSLLVYCCPRHVEFW